MLNILLTITLIALASVPLFYFFDADIGISFLAGGVGSTILLTE